MNNILILASSPRKNGNSDKMAESFYRGAKEAGNNAKILFVRDMKIMGCCGCEYCYEHAGNCCQLDDMQQIYRQLEDTDVLVFATPIYYQAFPSQLKAIVDRLYVTENRSFPIKGAVLLATYATLGEEMSKMTIAYFNTLIHYHGWENCGVIVKDGLDEPDDIEKDDVLESVYKLGLSIEVRK